MLIILFLTFNVINHYRKNERISNIDASQIRSITLINHLDDYAKEITKRNDIDSICHFINSVDMHRIKNWDGIYREKSEFSFTFILSSNTSTIEIDCQGGVYLVNNGVGYSIQNDNFEKFWNLDYKEAEYIYEQFE